MITIRRLTANDYRYVESINRLLPQLSEKTKPLTKEEFLEGITFAHMSIYLFGIFDDSKDESDDMVGMAEIFFGWRPEGWIGYIHSVTVDKNYRGKGLGNKLQLAMENEAKNLANAIKRKIDIDLTSRPTEKRETARQMYLKHGFKIISKAVVDEKTGEVLGTDLFRKTIEPS